MIEYSALQSERPKILKLRRDRYHALVAAKGWWTQADQAKGLRMSQSAISRIVRCEGKPGEKAIAALLAAFPEETDKTLFEFVEDDATQRGAA